MAKYPGVAKEVGQQANQFANEVGLNPEQRVQLANLLQGITRMASGGRLQRAWRLTGMEIMAREIEGIKPNRYTPEGRDYENVSFETEEPASDA